MFPLLRRGFLPAGRRAGGGQACYLVTLLLCSLVTLAQATPYHAIEIDGDLSDWVSGELVDDDSGDGEVLNRIDGLYVTWDNANLYIGVNYRLDNKGMLVYLDKYYGASDGYDDLTQLNTWDKDAKFTEGNFHPDYMYGSWDGSDGNFYRITSSGTAVDVSASVSTDFTPDIPGTEISVAWSDIFTNGFEKGAAIALFASICDASALSTDSSPDNSSASLPLVDNCIIVQCDTDNDGTADNFYSSKLLIHSLSAEKLFSPNDDGVNDILSIHLSLTQPSQVYLRVFSIEGRKIFQSSHSVPDSSLHTLQWSGKSSNGDYLDNGVYIISVTAQNSAGERAYKNRAVAIVK